MFLNAILREKNDVLEEKTFDVEVEENPFEMRNDTKLVIVDIPGINEAGANTKYKDFVNEHWHTFDCVILVLDGRQDINTDENIQLLQMVQQHCRTIKNVSVIVVMNKVDDGDNNEQNVLVEEARSAVTQIFVDEGTTHRRFQPRAKGRACKILKRTSHLTVTVGDGR